MSPALLKLIILKDYVSLVCEQTEWSWTPLTDYLWQLLWNTIVLVWVNYALKEGIPYRLVGSVILLYMSVYWVEWPQRLGWPTHLFAFCPELMTCLIKTSLRSNIVGNGWLPFTSSKSPICSPEITQNEVPRSLKIMQTMSVRVVSSNLRQ